MPIYLTAQAMAKLPDGEVLEILCTDPGSLSDFPAFVRQAGHELLYSEAKQDAQIFRIRKGRKQHE